jgi:hypothetical protein
MRFTHPSVLCIETEYYKSFIKNTLKILMLPGKSASSGRQKTRRKAVFIDLSLIWVDGHNAKPILK